MLQSVCVGIPDSYRAVCSASLDSAVQRTRRGLSRQTGTVSGAAWPAGDLQAVSLPAPRSIRTHNQHHLYFTIRNHSSSLGDWDVAEYEWSSYSGCSEMSWECVGQHPPLFFERSDISLMFLILWFGYSSRRLLTSFRRPFTSFSGLHPWSYFISVK